MLAAACGSNGAAPNIDPVAMLSAAPTLVQVGAPVAFDASASSDADGFIQQYRFDFADATAEIATATSGAQHAFARAGVYEVRLFVVDDRGGEGTTTIAITVTDEPPPGGCTGDGQCQPNEHCVMGDCVPADACMVPSPACPPPLVCDLGFCRCPGATEQCGDACVDTTSDPGNCGSCGHACATGDVCSGGTCQPICPPPTQLCPSGCSNPANDNANCGFCGHACDVAAGESCQMGTCVNIMCPPPFMLCPDGGCDDLSSDPANCGMCGNKCGPTETCQMFSCVGMICPGGEMFCPGTGCTDIFSDPANCGFCGNDCGGNPCLMGSCFTAPPGTVIASYPPAPYTVVRGLTHVNGNWYMTTGRRFVQFDNTSGFEIGEWFIDNEAMKRDYGLAGKSGPMGEDDLYTGVYNRFGSPLMNVSLDEYTAYGMHFSSTPNLGGAMADDEAGHLYVFYNQSQELYELDDTTFAVITMHPVSGLGMGDTFSDAALDGYGGLWLVRPDIPGGAGAAMKKIDLLTGAVILDVPPPSPNGVGGVELVDGSLWGLGADGMYQMVP